ncbi:MAG: TadE/TadG family type IV pilus assembly protein [Terriglobales bacterium]
MSRSINLRMRILCQAAKHLWCESEGSAILEFAIALPLLVVFTIGIYDFSAAFDEKQKIEQAAQEGAIVAGAQPTSDLFSDLTANANPPSLQPVASAVLNSLAGSGVTTAACAPGAPSAPSGLTWTYTISGCSSAYPSDNLVIAINRGWVCSSIWPTPGTGRCASAPPEAVGTTVTITYSYHWRFSSVIQFLVPGASYAAQTSLTEASTVHNQM